ncbi:MAG: type IX secretion system protein PorQ [Bacteroidales bacterium]|nr:type IX secretion system protein PorQ [Bacteroidales bacterium]
MKYLCIITFLILFCVKTYSQIGGEYVYTFMNIPMGGNNAALGGGGICSGNQGVNYLFSNPAMIDSSMNKNIAVNYVDYISDIHFGSFAFTYHLLKNWNFSTGVLFANYGTFESTNEAGIQSGTFYAKDQAIYLSVSRNIIKNLDVAISLKTIFSHLETYKSWGIAFDFGLHYYLPQLGINIGGVVKNLGFQIKPYTNSNREKLPLNIQIGASKILNHAPLQFLLIFNNLQHPQLSDEFSQSLANHLILGLELFPKSTVSVKAGMNILQHNELRVSSTSPFPGFSFGADVKLKRFSVQYSRACYSAAASINMFTVEVFLSKIVDF